MQAKEEEADNITIPPSKWDDRSDCNNNNKLFYQIRHIIVHEKLAGSYDNRSPMNSLTVTRYLAFHYIGYRISWPIRRTVIFSLQILGKKNNDECISLLVIYWKKTGLLHTKISNHNIIYSS